MNRKPVILTFVGAYLPGYKSGGPVRTIVNMVDQLADHFDFHIVTADRDFSEVTPYPNVKADCWNAVGKAKVFYTSPGNRGVAAFSRVIESAPFDVLYLNSFFSPVFTVRPLVARRLGMLPHRPVVLAPRGEFSAGALALKSAKKRGYICVARALGIYRNIVWQASSAYEETDIANALGGVAKCIRVAPNLPSTGASSAREPQPARRAESPLRVCFVSRISPKKNLEFALNVLRRVKTPVTFNIYGPVEDAEYWKRCEALIGALGPAVTAHYRGSLEHDRVSGAFAQHDLFFLPTLGENFGHVIMESLLAGTPVLLADTTPWRNLQELGVGWDLPLSESDRFVAAIEQAASVPPAGYAQWRERVRDYALSKVNNKGPLEANVSLFRQAMEGAATVAGAC